MDTAIPIFAFHRVGPRAACRFTVPPDVFEQYLRVLRAERYTTLTCRELAAIVAGRLSPPRRACLLTFDDGYADVWVYAAPLLRRYAMRATVFVVLERLGDAPHARPTLDDMWAGRCRAEELYRLPDLRRINAAVLEPGYAAVTDHVSWEEARRLVADGVCDVQSHGLDHMVEFCSDRVRGFLHPRSHWLVAAAARRDRRLGTPVYDVNPAMVAPRFHDPAVVRDRLAEVARSNGGAAFFERAGWSEILMGELRTGWAESGSGRFEPLDAWKNGMLDGLRTCIRVLGDRLGASIAGLAWPFGAMSAEGQRSAEDAGFTVALTTKCGGYAPGMPRMGIGRVSLKEHDAGSFRQALRRYSNPEEIYRELDRAVYDGPLAISV